MNVVIRTDASLEIGTGHLMRCLALAGELKARGAQVSFACSEGAGDLLERIDKKEYGVCRLPKAATEESKKNILLEYISKNRSPVDWLVVDHYGLDSSWEAGLRTIVKKIMVMDDLADRSHDCDLLLDQNFYNEAQSRYGGRVPAHCWVLAGPRYALLRPEFLAARRTAQIRRGKIRRILIFMGGADTNNITKKALEAVKSLDGHEFITDVVVGSSNPHKNDIKKICSESDGLRFHCGIDNISELMLQAQLSIGGGGITTWERCCLGLPTITIVLADNQKEALSALDENKIVMNLGQHENVTVQKIKEAVLRFMKNPDLIPDFSAEGLRTVDAYGTKRAVSAMIASSKSTGGWKDILSDIEKFLVPPRGFRFELIDDRHTPSIVRWRNDPAVNTYFVQRQTLTAEFQEDFLKNYSQKDRLDFVLVSETQGLPVGVFSVKNISTAPEIGKMIGERKFRGRGIAAAATSALIDFSFEFLRPKEILAKTQKRNETNIRLNEKLGFKRIGAENIEGAEYLTMKITKEDFKCVEYSAS